MNAHSHKFPKSVVTDDHACKVCGFDIQVTGYDCLVCQTVAELPDDALNPVSAVHMAASVNRAITASVRSGEVNQPIPDARWMAQAGVRF
ncbi:hypothetical protein [Novosphingobium sp. MMS21-SN21R]|uniref:hypothetical protein n=1 Tax=Novosphingobium sp. MMS21-SN21R TaxID=2969298 RepID=UPI0028889F41|nr:hypothetical protein [Novosphingobium sp. MMS21-SN21R]MDT0507511.1 hypothetical protein [Novosphingobium sp. MMS21-SN21R]